MPGFLFVDPFLFFSSGGLGFFSVALVLFGSFPLDIGLGQKCFLFRFAQFLSGDKRIDVNRFKPGLGRIHPFGWNEGIAGGTSKFARA